MQLRDVIVGLLHSLGSRKEVSKYLEMFTRDGGQQRVLIKVGGGTLENELDILAPAIASLSLIGMAPVVVHGAGPQLTRELEQRGIDSKWINGQRVTTPEVLALARKVFQREGHRLAVRLESMGVSTRTITSGIFGAKPSSHRELGLVGDVTDAQVDALLDTLEHAAIPIVSPLGETIEGQILNINADVATRELAVALRINKVVFLTPEGGIRDEHGEVISAIDLENDAQRMLDAPWVHGGMELKLREIARLLDHLPASSSVSITSPEHLAAQLFTHRGNGTFIRRGTPLTTHTSFGEIDQARLRAVIEGSFGRALNATYFDRDVPGLSILIGGNYEAVAILRDAEDAVYLDKFTVSAEAKGHGLWNAITELIDDTSETLLWRSREHNTINGWYAERADGMVRRDGWVIYWKNARSFDDAPRLVDIAMQQPQDLPTITTCDVSIEEQTVA